MDVRSSLVHMRAYRSRGGVPRAHARVSQQGGRHEDLADEAAFAAHAQACIAAGGRHEDLADEAAFSAHAQRSWQGLTDGLRDSTAI